MKIIRTEYSIEQNLKDAGCTKDFIKYYMSIQSDGREQVKLLEDYRNELVKQMHGVQRQLECLDYLLFYKRREV